MNEIDDTFDDKIDAASSIVNDSKKQKCTNNKKQKDIKQTLTNILCEIDDNLADTYESDLRNNDHMTRKNYILNDPFLYFRRCNKKEGEVFLDVKFSYLFQSNFFTLIHYSYCLDSNDMIL